MTSDEDFERRLTRVAEAFVGRVPEEDIRSATDLFTHREWGVGLELLCGQLDEHDVRLAPREYAELLTLASRMGVDITGFGLAP